MKVFLTGGTGFLGSHIAEELYTQRYDLLLSKRTTSNLNRCTTFVENVLWVDTDSNDFESIVSAFAPDIIINAAWDGVAAGTRGDWSIQIENLQFQQKLLNIALKVGTTKIIGIGSQAEYGQFDGQIDEQYLLQPDTAYGAVKLSSQIILKSFCEQYKIAWFWFRLYSCFGEREADNWLIPATIKNILTKDFMDLTPGEQKYSYLYIKDVARLIVHSINCDADSGVYHIASDTLRSLKEILSFIKEYLNPDFQLNFGALSYRKGQSMINGSINTKTRLVFGEYEKSDFERILIHTIEYYKQKYRNEK